MCEIVHGRKEMETGKEGKDKKRRLGRIVQVTEVKILGYQKIIDLDR